MLCGPSSSGFRNGRLLRRRRGSRLRRARRLRPALTRSPIRDHKRESAKRPSRCAARSDSGTPSVNEKARLDFEAGLVSLPNSPVEPASNPRPATRAPRPP